MSVLGIVAFVVAVAIKGGVFRELSEIKFYSALRHEILLEKYFKDTRDYLERCLKAGIFTRRAIHRVKSDLQTHIAKTEDENEKRKLVEALSEISKLWETSAKFPAEFVRL